MLKLPQGTPQYFFDNSLIAEQQHVVRRWLPASVFPDPVLLPDRPWEGRSLVLYGSVLPDPVGGYRMYYSCFCPGLHHSLLMLATSLDGFTWEKPALGLVEYQGSRENNILIQPDCPMDSPSVIFDPEDSSYPYKMICFQNTQPPPMWGDDWGIYSYHSVDGLQWERISDKPLRMGDRNSLFHDPRSGKYHCFTRDPEMFARAGGRHISCSESVDFRSWSAPELLLARDLEDEAEIEFYGMPVFMRHGWYFGLLEYWNSKIDVIEVHLALSRDGKHWQRPLPHTPFIAATYPWNRSWSTCANNGPVIMKETMVFYFGGRYVAHGWGTALQHGVIGYATLPLDRFCALEGKTGAQFTTLPFVWPGGSLVVNADTRESYNSHPGNCNGELRVDVLDGKGKLLPEWSGEQTAIFQGNSHCRGNISLATVKWPGGRDLHSFVGQGICLRFHLRHARLFTIAAMPAESL